MIDTNIFEDMHEIGLVDHTHILRKFAYFTMMDNI